MSQMYNKCNQMDKKADNPFYDPLWEISDELELMGSLQFAKDVGKIIFATIMVATFMIAIIAQIGIDCTWADCLEILNFFALALTVSAMWSLGERLARHASFTRFQMSGRGSNLLGTLMKILTKLGYIETRMMGMTGLSRDLRRIVSQVVRDALLQMQDWERLERDLQGIKLEMLESAARRPNWSKRSTIGEFQSFIDHALSESAKEIQIWRSWIEGVSSADGTLREGALESDGQLLTAAKLAEYQMQEEMMKVLEQALQGFRANLSAEIATL